MLVSQEQASLHGTRLGLMRAIFTREPGGFPKLFFSWLSYKLPYDMTQCEALTNVAI